MQRDNATAEPKAVARFLSKAMTIKGPKLCCAKAWFHCSQFQNIWASEAARCSTG